MKTQKVVEEVAAPTKKELLARIDRRIENVRSVAGNYRIEHTAALRRQARQMTVGFIAITQEYSADDVAAFDGLVKKYEKAEREWLAIRALVLKEAI